MKIVIFGLGKKFTAEKDRLFADHDIVALTDNDRYLWGKSINGINCISPNKILDVVSNDDVEVYICVATPACIQIYKQLIDIGITNKQICNPICCSINDLSEFSTKHQTYDDSWKQIVLASPLADSIQEYHRKTPEDPFSSEYQQYIMAFYEFLSGRKYEPLTNEGFSSANLIEISDDIGKQKREKTAEVFQQLTLGHNMRIIEMGCGYGFALEFLCSISDKVFALEASCGLCEYARNQLKKAGLNAKIIRGEFYDIKDITETFDVIIFQSAVHHCPDFVRLLKILRSKLSNSGRIYLIGEDIRSIAQHPWHISLHNEALFQICVNGWLELYLSEGYLIEALENNGFRIEAKFANVITENNYEVVKLNESYP